jgi:hypothetical protein
MLSEFIRSYPQVAVKINLASSEAYTELREDISFDLIVFDNEIEFNSNYLDDISAIYQESTYDKDKFPLLERCKEEFIETKAIPLLFEVPIIYENQLYPDLPVTGDYEDYINNKVGFLGTTSDYAKIQSDMPGVYKIKEEFLAEKPCNVKMWVGIGKDLPDEKRVAATRIIMFLLSDNAQEELAIVNDEGLPVNKSVWDVFIEINNEFSFLNDAMDSMHFGT